VTGASDDDPSGIGTYSQVGVQFGYGLLWTMVVSYSLMVATQEISARVTGAGIAANLRKNCPKPFLYGVLFVVSVANVFSLGADIGAMGAAMQLLLPGEDKPVDCDVWRRIIGRCPAGSIFNLCEVP
jgi:Mn2+/Fe2+ NRAMP family transporter